MLMQVHVLIRGSIESCGGQRGLHGGSSVGGRGERGKASALGCPRYPRASGRPVPVGRPAGLRGRAKNELVNSWADQPDTERRAVQGREGVPEPAPRRVRPSIPDIPVHTRVRMPETFREHPSDASRGRGAASLAGRAVRAADLADQVSGQGAANAEVSLGRAWNPHTGQASSEVSAGREPPPGEITFIHSGRQ